MSTMGKRQTGKPVKTSILNSEAIESGIQYLMPDIAPITQNDRIAQKCSAPMMANCEQHPCDIGLFDIIQHNQIDLLDYLRTEHHSPTILPMTQLNQTKTQQE